VSPATAAGAPLIVTIASAETRPEASTMSVATNDNASGASIVTNNSAARPNTSGLNVKRGRRPTLPKTSVSGIDSPGASSSPNTKNGTCCGESSTAGALSTVISGFDSPSTAK